MKVGRKIEKVDTKHNPYKDNDDFRVTNPVKPNELFEELNEKCKTCIKECKQSNNVDIMYCPLYEKVK